MRDRKLFAIITIGSLRKRQKLSFIICLGRQYCTVNRKELLIMGKKRHVIKLNLPFILLDTIESVSKPKKMWVNLKPRCIL